MPSIHNNTHQKEEEKESEISTSDFNSSCTRSAPPWLKCIDRISLDWKIISKVVRSIPSSSINWYTYVTTVELWISIRTKEGVTSLVSGKLHKVNHIGLEKWWKTQEVLLLVCWIVCSSGWARIDEKLAIMLICFKFMCVASNKNVYSKLPLEGSQGFWVTPWNNLMTMSQANFELSNSYNLLFGIRAGKLGKGIHLMWGTLITLS